MIVPRPALERRITASVDAGRIPVVLGGCGTGRTSLLLRVAQALGPSRAQYLSMSGIATTPERCLEAVVGVCPLKPPSGKLPSLPSTPRAAFDGLLDVLRRGHGGRRARDLPARRSPRRAHVRELPGPAPRPARADRTARGQPEPVRPRLALHGARAPAAARRPARFEVVHVPPLDDAGRRGPGGCSSATTRPEWARAAAPAVACAGGRTGRRTRTSCSTRWRQLGPTTDPIAALSALFAPDGRLTARLPRIRYEFRLHRARGYGALKAILGVLADIEPLNLTEIAHRLHRTPGSTKDYLSWLEDVDLLARAAQALRIRRSAAARLRAAVRTARAADRRRSRRARSQAVRADSAAAPAGRPCSSRAMRGGGAPRFDQPGIIEID